MDEQETRKAITFFHNLNLILHYQTDELDMLVIINLKPILDLVSLTIGVSFIDEDELHDSSAGFPSIFLLVPVRENSIQNVLSTHMMVYSNSQQGITALTRQSSALVVSPCFSIMADRHLHM